MAKQIYQVRNGERVTLTAREVKAYVMKERKWTSEQYQKEYDKLRNRLRAYEGFQMKSGIEVEKQSAAHILYFESKARKREGREYQRTIELERIYSFQSVSSGKALEKLLSSDKSLRKLQNVYLEGTMDKFGGFINKNPKAAEIFTKIEDPVKLEQALIDYANKVYAKSKKKKSDDETAAILFEQAIGSDTPIDFDIEKYL